MKLVYTLCQKCIIIMFKFDSNSALKCCWSFCCCLHLQLSRRFQSIVSIMYKSRPRSLQITLVQGSIVWSAHASIHSRGKFARLCVELDLNQPLVPTISFYGAWFSGCLHLICFACGRSLRSSVGALYWFYGGCSLITISTSWSIPIRRTLGFFFFSFCSVC